jgi:hypothetical protein
LNKQAQQPASDTTPGLRPPDVHALSSGTKKCENYSRRPDLVDSGSVVSTSGHRPINPGRLPKVLVGTHQPRGASCELCPLSTSLIYYVKAATSSVTIKPHYLSEGVTQNFGTSRSPLLPQSARSSSTLVSIGNSQYQAHSAPPTTHKKQHVSSSLVNQGSTTAHDHPGALPCPQFPQEIPIHAPLVTALMGTIDLEAMPASKNQQGILAKISQGAHTCSKFLPVTRLIASMLPRVGLDAQSISCIPATRSRSGLPLQRYPRIVSFTFCCLCYNHCSSTSLFTSAAVFIKLS